MADEVTLVIIKPDAIQKGLTGLVLDRLAQTPLRIVAAKSLRVSRALAEQHYQHLKHKPFFQELIAHLIGELHQADIVLAFIYIGPGAITIVRELAGATNPEKAGPKTLRGAFGRNTAQGWMENVIHASSDATEAEREIKLWFSPDEILVPLYPTTQTTGVRLAWQ